MFGSLGVPELIFIFALALLIFGPRKLPEIGRTLGRGLSEFRKASTDLKRSINAEMIEDELRQSDPRNVLRQPPAKATSRPEPPASSSGDGSDGGQEPPPAAAGEPPGAAAPAGSVPRSAPIGAPSGEVSTGETPAANADSEAP